MSDIVKVYPEQSHNDPQEDNKIIGNMNFGSTGANNDAQIQTNGETLESMMMNIPTSFGGGVASIGQQAPRTGRGDLGE